MAPKVSGSAETRGANESHQETMDAPSDVLDPICAADTELNLETAASSLGNESNQPQDDGDRTGDDIWRRPRPVLPALHHNQRCLGRIGFVNPLAAVDVLVPL